MNYFICENPPDGAKRKVTVFGFGETVFSLLNK